MGKKKKTQAFVLKPWCWYCEREFEDEKVLLQHQKSKHFKCQLCPRKLNTAGGLMVHSQQVHKTEPEPLTNTLPGRDGYDIEIFGMEGVPTNALAEWKARKEQEAGASALAASSQNKRPRFAYAVVPEADLMEQLERHKRFMAIRHAAAGHGPPAGVPPFPPPGGAAPPFPPPGFIPPAGMPPFRPPFPPPAGMPPFPPGAGMPPFPGMPPPTLPSGDATPTTPVRPPPAFIAASGTRSASPAKAAPVSADVKPPANGVFWPDNDATPAEKRALLPKYRYSPSSTPDGAVTGTKRKAAADFL